MQVTDIADKNAPYWWEDAPVRAQPDQPLGTQVDVAIVGAGYAGLAAGLVLARAGRSVYAFDAMNPGEGASSRNGGITSGNIRPSFAALSARFGEDKALAVEAEGKAARDFLGDFIRREGLACDFRETGLFVGAIGARQYESMARSAESLATRLGIEAYAVPQAEQREYAGTDFYRGGTVRMDIGGLHPAKFHSELLRVALASGVAVHSQTPVLSIEREKEAFTITTPRGAVTARQVLVCTNGYTDGATPFLRQRLVPVRSRMIATQELPLALMAQLMPRGMMMGEGLKLGYYYRPCPEGKRILLGGRDGSFKGDPVGPIVALRKGLVSRYPELADIRISHTWFGHVAMNRDMLPRLFERDGVLYATGFCGSGTVWAPWVGTRAAYRLLGEEHEAITAFEFAPPASVPLYRGNPWFMPAVIQGYRLQDLVSLWRSGR